MPMCDRITGDGRNLKTGIKRTWSKLRDCPITHLCTYSFQIFPHFLGGSLNLEIEAWLGRDYKIVLMDPWPDADE